MAWRWSLGLVLVVLLPFTSSSASIVKSLPGFEGDLPFKLETGYIGLGEEDALQLFYLFVESAKNPSTDPLLIWLIGGPGCTSLSGFFLENGPLVFQHPYTGGIPKLQLNPYAWTQELNVIYLDIPVGSGFSYSETQEGWYSNDTLSVEHLHEFLQKWFISHPAFSSNPFYVGGGSYSGKLIPPLVEIVYEGHKAGDTPNINIKGYVLASPVTIPDLEENSRVEYAHRMYLTPDDLYESMKTNCDGDYVNLKTTACAANYTTYSELVRYIDLLNIMENVCLTTPTLRSLLQDSQSGFWCRGYDNIYLDTWANDPSVREALHVRPGTMGQISRCNETVSTSAYIENFQNLVEYHQRLTNTDLNALIYCSDLDMQVPQLSTSTWMKAINLPVYGPWRPWNVDDLVAGFTRFYSRNYEYNLTFANVKGAGHVAHIYKPKQVYHMIQKWFEHSTF